MEFLGELNYLAIVVAVVVTMAIGFWWYSKGAFGNIWLKHQRFTPEEVEEMKGKGMGGTMVFALILQFIIIGAFNFTVWATGIHPLCISALFLIGIIFPLLAGSSLWEKKPWPLFWVNLGHWTVVLLVTGLIFLMWN